MRTRTALGALVLPLCLGLASTARGETKDMVSSVLEGKRVAYLVCELVNKSGGLLDGVQLTLKVPDGSPVGSPFSCPVLAHGATCALEHEIGFPALTFAAYCHAQLPKAFVRGSLRLLDKSRNTLAQSDLEGDLHGKVASLESQLQRVLALVGDNVVVAYIDDDSDDQFDEEADRVVARLVDANLDRKPSDGDLLVPARYPLDFPSSTGALFSGPILCDSVIGTPGVVICTSARLATDFRFVSDSGTQEFSTVQAGFLVRDDIGGADVDSIQVSTSSVLEPNFDISTTQAGGTDDDFLDVDFSP